MNESDISKLSEEQLETFILENTSNPAIQDTFWLAIIKRLKSLNAEKAKSSLELLEEAAQTGKKVNLLIELLKIKASLAENDNENLAENFSASLIKCCKDSTADLLFIAHSGFNQKLPVLECLRRFSILRQLPAGSYCYDRTWGFGVVSAIDEFDKAIIIDFEKKSKHRMSLSYAAEVLNPLPRNNILVRRHLEKETFPQWMMENPATAIKELIATLGPLSAPQLQETIEGKFIPAEQWKKFWEQARRLLKEDSLVIMPSKRTEPIRLLKKERTLDDEWFKEFSAERDMEKILNKLEELASFENAEEAIQPQLEAIEDKIIYVLRGAQGTSWPLYVKALLLTKQLNIALKKISFKEALKLTAEPSVLEQILEKLPAKYMEDFFQLLYQEQGNGLIEIINNCLTELDTTAFNTYLNFAEATGNKGAAMEKIASLIRTNIASPEIVCWLCKNTGTADFSISNEELLRLGWNALENFSGSGARLKAKNQLKQLFESKEWLARIFDGMDKNSIKDFIRSVQFSKKLNSNERSSLLAKIINIHPDLTDVLAEKKADTPTLSVRLTSIKSWKEKQRLLEKIINEDIPKNSNDIAVARSYGDLRENFEYKSAKEMQGMLMQRKAELTEAIAKIKPTDFKGIPADTVIPGVTVTIEKNGSKTTYTILGEWDNDEALKIISNKSKMAQALIGKKAGDTTQVPDENGDLKECVISKIEPLSDEIKQWILS
jgi:transcription elongation factor GreA-like protein/transcription elongation GreA/GreB family factor